MKIRIHSGFCNKGNKRRNGTYNIRCKALRNKAMVFGRCKKYMLPFQNESFEGELKSSDEGRNFWIKRSDIGNYKLAPLFDIFLKVFEDPDISEYYHPMDGEETDVLLK